MMDKREEKEITLKWIHTSDTHGDLFGYDYRNGCSCSGGLSSVYEYLKRNEKEYGDRLLVTDGGDCLQGSPLAYYYNFIDTHSPHLVAQVMNEMGYVCGVMGNHDIEVGRCQFQRWMQNLNFPILGANVVDKKTGKPYLQPYAVVCRSGIKIAILGLVTPVIPYYQPEKLWKELLFEEMLPCAKQWVEYIRQVERPDIIVGLFHSGFDGGIIVEGKCHENLAGVIAEQIPGFDLICYGHDHIPAIHRVKNIEGKEVVCMSAAGVQGCVSVAEINLTIKNGEIIFKTVNGKLLNFSDFNVFRRLKSCGFYPLHTYKRAITRKYSIRVKKIRRWASSPLCRLSDTLYEQDGYFGPCRFIDYIHQMQLDMSGAAISFVTPLSYNIRLKEGSLHIGDLFSLLEYEEFVYALRLSGEEILGMLEVSYGEWINTMHTPKDNLLKMRRVSLSNIAKDIVSRLFGRLIGKVFKWILHPAYAAAGISYTVDVTKPQGNRIIISSLVDGTPFDLNKEYTVAVNRRIFVDRNSCLYVGSGLSQQELIERIISISEKALPYYMMCQMENQQVVIPELVSKWRFIPEDLVRPAIKKERRWLKVLAS